MSDLYLAQANLAAFDPEWSAAVLLEDHGRRAIMAAADLVLIHGFSRDSVVALYAEAGAVMVIRVFEACRKTVATGLPADYLPLTASPYAYSEYSDWYFRRTGQVLAAAHSRRTPLRNLVAQVRGRPPLPETV